jgi:uncharacterized protein YggU (UPF0235/DUF167 family)
MKLIITAKAGAGKNLVQKNDDMHYTVWTTAVPERGKANDAIIALLAEFLDVPKSRLQITAGRSGRTKTISLLEHP